MSNDVRRSAALLRAARLLVIAGLFLAGGCGDEPAPVVTEGEQPAQQTMLDPVLLRAPFFALTDHDGKSFRSDSLRGRLWIANFFCTRSKEASATQTERMRAIQERVAARAERESVRLVSITVDPATDTPARLKEHAETYGADLEQWTFLTGEEEALRLLSSEGFGLPVRPTPDDTARPVEHSPQFVLVDWRGLVRGTFDSRTDAGMQALEAAIDRLLAEPNPALRSRGSDIDGASYLPGRARAQREASASWTVRHDLRFKDRIRASRIKFENRITDDGARHMLAVHYDHGNGVAVADVDGDGRLDLYFTNQVGSNQLWRNVGGGRFEDITQEAGVAVKDVISVTASFADTDNDGDPDLFVSTVRGGNHLFINDGKGRFEDVSKAAGVDHVGHSSAGVFFDFDRDGLLDLFVCNVGIYTQGDLIPIIEDSTTAGQEPGDYAYYRGVKDAFAGHMKPQRNELSLLYRNLGGNRFEEVHAKMGLEDICWTGAAAPIDVNGDGWLDLYVLDMQGHDEYYENVGGKRFVRKSREVFPRTSWGAMGIQVFDYDVDGDLDIYITDMHSDMCEVVPPDEEKRKARMWWPESLTRSGGKSIWGNSFFEQVAPGRFEEVSDRINVENFWPWGMSVADLNADGFEDIFVTCSMNYLFRYQSNNVLLNDGGKRFLDSEFVLGVEPRSGPLTRAWFDLNCDVARDSKHILCKDVSGPVVVWAPRGSRSSAIFDLEGDGDLDVVTNEFNSEPQVLVSDLAGRGGVNFLKVALRGTRSNRDGLGAIVRLTAGGRTYMRQHDGQSGYLSQSSMPLYFGLGKATSVARIVVTWPSGLEQTVTKDIPVNGLLVIEEPAK